MIATLTLELKVDTSACTSHGCVGCTGSVVVTLSFEWKAVTAGPQNAAAGKFGIKAHKMAVGNAPGATPLQRRLGMLAQSYFLVLGQDKQELEWNPPNPKNPPRLV